MLRSGDRDDSSEGGGKVHKKRGKGVEKNLSDLCSMQCFLGQEMTR
jgi:hypothetical protein